MIGNLPTFYEGRSDRRTTQKERKRHPKFILTRLEFLANESPCPRVLFRLSNAMSCGRTLHFSFSSNFIILIQTTMLVLKQVASRFIKCTAFFVNEQFKFRFLWPFFFLSFFFFPSCTSSRLALSVSGIKCSGSCL